MSNWKEFGGGPPEVVRGIEWPRVGDRQIYVDLNRTLLTSEGIIVPGSEEALSEVIRHADEHNVEIILNSDSPSPQLYRLAARLGFIRGQAVPGILAENGILYYDSYTDQAYAILEIPDRERVISHLEDRLRNLGIHIFPPRIAPEFGELNEIDGEEGQIGVAFGRDRVCTITIFGGQRRGDDFVVNSSVTDQVAELFKELLPEDTFLYYDPRPAYIALYPLYPDDVYPGGDGERLYQYNKVLGVAQLLKFNPKARAILIGDDERDLTHGIGDGRILAGMVGNALPQYRERADLQSDREYTWGTIDLINQAISYLTKE